MPASPRLSGAPLRRLAQFARTSVGGVALQRILRAELRIDALAGLPESARGDVPLDMRPVAGRAPRAGSGEELAAPPRPWSETTSSYVERYREGSLTPRQAVEKALEEARRLARLSPSVGPLCDYADAGALEAADRATERWKQGKPIGPLDGVPYAVKEQTAVKGMPRRGGTAFLDPSPQPEDATCVSRLWEAGAIVIGMTPMTEFGMTPNGANSKRAMPRNPHATDHIAGGSSTGSGVAVATGLVPFAIGADGGGSIRIPSALNGVFGIKPTWGRVSRYGDISTGSVAHVGPLAGSVLDLARSLELMSGHDPRDTQTWLAPPREAGSFVRGVGRGVRGMVIGVEEGEWAAASEPVQRAGREALAALEREGAKLVPVTLDLARHAPAIGYVTIACEARAALRASWREHWQEMGDDLVVSFSSLDAFGAVEYLETQRLRAGLRRELARAFERIDLLAMPSVVAPAAAVSERDMSTGFLDTTVIDGLCRFAFLCNLTGLPALSAPVGCDIFGLPLGLQLIGDAWDEATVFAAAAHLERIGAAGARRPRVTVRD